MQSGKSCYIANAKAIVKNKIRVDDTRFESAAMIGTAKLSGSKPFLKPKIISMKAIDWTTRNPNMFIIKDIPRTNPIF